MTSISFQIHAAGGEVCLRLFKTPTELQRSENLFSFNSLLAYENNGRAALQVVLHLSFVPAWLLTGAMSLVAFPPLNGLRSCNLIKDLTSSPHGYNIILALTHAHTHTGSLP